MQKKLNNSIYMIDLNIEGECFLMMIRSNSYSSLFYVKDYKMHTNSVGNISKTSPCWRIMHSILFECFNYW